MNNQKLQKTKMTVLATALALSVGTTIYLEDRHNNEVEALQKKLEKSISYSAERENVIIELQNVVANKSETIIEMQGNYDALKTNYDSTKAEYEKNLKQLNVLEGELKKKKTGKITEVTSVANVDLSSWKKMVVQSTAYTKFENGDELAGRKWGNLTKSGVPVHYGVVAVDTDIIPLGTEIYIPSLNKVFVALDTGNAIKGNIIDVYFDSLEQCIEWGRKKGLEIYVNM